MCEYVYDVGVFSIFFNSLRNRLCDRRRERIKHTRFNFILQNASLAMRHNETLVQH